MKSRTKAVLDRDTLTKLVLHAFPGGRVEEICELTEGMFNAVFLITGAGLPEPELVLKIGPAAGTPLLTYEKDILKAEVCAYQLLQGKGLPIPQIFTACFDRELIPCDYFFMSRLPGVLWKNADEARLASCRAELLEELGRINRCIHSVTGSFFGYLKEESHFQHSSWGNALAGMMEDLLLDGRRLRCQLPYEELRQALRRHAGVLDEIKTPRLVDFDLWAGNVFLAEKGSGYRISGIIDLERRFFGDPWADYISAVQIFDDIAAEPDFLRGCGELSPDSAAERRMDLYRLYMSVIQYVEAYRFEPAYRNAVRRWCRREIRYRLDKLAEV